MANPGRGKTYNATGKTAAVNGRTRNGDWKNAILPGLEPGTYGLEGRCSIQLSYRTKMFFISILPEGY